MKNGPLKKAVLIEKSANVFKYVYKRYVLWEIKVMLYRTKMSAL